MCGHGVQCDFHRDGGSRRNKCYGLCDVRGCRELATTETGPRGRSVCDAHAKPRAVGRPVSTGSATGPVVAFRLGAADQARARAAADAESVTVGELARRTLLARLG